MVAGKQTAIFGPYRFSTQDRATLDRDGHFLLPALLTSQACERLTESLADIESLRGSAVEGQNPRRFSAEFDGYLESLIGHPQLLELARNVLGQEIRYDHCVALNRSGDDQGIGWHSHGYAEDDPALGFVRIFFYVNGFEPDDGGLKVVSGSHLFRDPDIRARTDAELQMGWMAGKMHPKSGEALEIEALSVPPGTVALMWAHAAHAVSPRRPGSDTRWAVVYAYRNPGQPSRARWISEEFERNPSPGAEGLMSLY